MGGQWARAAVFTSATPLVALCIVRARTGHASAVPACRTLAFVLAAADVDVPSCRCSPPFGCGVRSTSTTSSSPLPSTAPGPRGTRTSTTARGNSFTWFVDSGSSALFIIGQQPAIAASCFNKPQDYIFRIWFRWLPPCVIFDPLLPALNSSCFRLISSFSLSLFSLPPPPYPSLQLQLEHLPLPFPPLLPPLPPSLSH